MRSFFFFILSVDTKILFQVEYKFKEVKIVPQLIPEAPAGYLEVSFNDRRVVLGEDRTPTEVQSQPQVWWNGSKNNRLYFLFMIDMDTSAGEYAHWVVGNIPGNRVDLGDNLAFFFPSAPPKDTGKHRYVFLWYEQLRRIDFSSFKPIPQFQMLGRLGFHTEDFVQKYNLGAPKAGNFYHCQWDPTSDVWGARLIRP